MAATYTRVAVLVAALLCLPIVLLLVFTEPSCACAPIEQMYLAQMRSDLRNLEFAQAAWRDSTGAFFTVPPSDEVYASHTDVTVEIGDVTEARWTAWARHARTTWECAATWPDTTGRATLPVACVDPAAPAGAPGLTQIIESLGRQWR